MANRVYGYQGYKGYQFETSPKKLQPEIEPEKQNMPNRKKTKKAETGTRNVNVKNNKANKDEVKKKAKLVAYIIFGFSILFTISYRNSIINEKFSQKEILKSELTEIQKVNEQLEVSVENELNLTSIEKIAKEKLGMSKLSNSQKIYVTLDKKEYVETSVSSTGNTENFFKKIYDELVNLFG